MRESICRLVAAITICASLVVGATSAAAQAPVRPLLKASPVRVAIGGTVTLKGSHLWRNQRILLLLAIPKIQSGASERFFKNFVKSDANGKLVATQQIPLVNRCGAATIYAYPFPTRKTYLVAARITITGCQSRKRRKIPPPPAP